MNWLKRYKSWLNLRNDDLFMHRFGSPDYVRELIGNMPLEHVVGLYMGSDGYFWGREFISKEPEMAGRLEIDKHWYNFRMFGEMAYNNDLDDAYWKAVLKHRFPTVDFDLLFEAWETVSEVVPQLNRSVWAATDGDFAPELCQGDSRLGGRQNAHWHAQAVKHIEDSRDHWKSYADVLDSHYRTSLHAKTGWFRWNDTLKQVEDEVERVKNEGALPVIEFADLDDDAKLDA